MRFRDDNVEKIKGQKGLRAFHRKHFCKLVGAQGEILVFHQRNMYLDSSKQNYPRTKTYPSPKKERESQSQRQREREKDKQTQTHTHGPSLMMVQLTIFLTL